MTTRVYQFTLPHLSGHESEDAVVWALMTKEGFDIACTVLAKVHAVGTPTDFTEWEPGTDLDASTGSLPHAVAHIRRLLMYRSARYRLPPPPVTTGQWQEADWIAFIEHYGAWGVVEEPDVIYLCGEPLYFTGELNAKGKKLYQRREDP